jgi:hypothetical protein
VLLLNKLLLATALVTLSSEVELKSPLDLGLRPICQRVAVELELVDPKEARYILARDDDFAADLLLVQRRYADLKAAPRVQDALRFPDRVTAQDFLACNRAYHQYLTALQTTDQGHADWCRSALVETDKLYQVWDLVRDARCDYYDVSRRREALQRLRAVLGEPAYYAGQLPPALPVSLFQRN